MCVREGGGGGGGCGNGPAQEKSRRPWTRRGGRAGGCRSARFGESVLWSEPSSASERPALAEVTDGHRTSGCGGCPPALSPPIGGTRSDTPSHGPQEHSFLSPLQGGGGGLALWMGHGREQDGLVSAPPPPLLGRHDGRGSGRGCPTCPGRGGGVNPTSMAQNDTHVALIILTTQIWGGGLLVEKTFSGQNFVLLRLRRPHPFLHKTKGPTRNPISPTPSPSFGRRPCHPHTPPSQRGPKPHTHIRRPPGYCRRW